MMLSYADQYRRDRTPAERETYLTLAEELSRDDASSRRANVLKARGDLRRYRADLEGAGRDYDDALALFQAVEDRLGQANVLKARGHLEGARGEWAQACRWYEEALLLYGEAQSPLGLGNTLAGIARACRELGQKEAARQAAKEALRLAIPGENRYAEQVARSVLEQLDGSDDEPENPPSREAATE